MKGGIFMLELKESSHEKIYILYTYTHIFWTLYVCVCIYRERESGCKCVSTFYQSSKDEKHQLEATQIYIYILNYTSQLKLYITRLKISHFSYCLCIYRSIYIYK